MAIETDNSVEVPAYMEPLNKAEIEEMDIDGADFQTDGANAEVKSPPSPSIDAFLCNEALDRSSPTLWPETVPGMTNFVADTGLPMSEVQTEWKTELTTEDTAMLFAYGSMAECALLEKVRELMDIAYELDAIESYEITRGRLLNILDHAKTPFSKAKQQSS